MTEDELIRKGMVVLQSSTVSLVVLPASCDDTSITSPDDAHDISIKLEEGTDIHIKEGIPEPVSFPSLKAQPDEVSYMAVCPLLDTFL
jgi:hypothetical protein